MSSHVNDQAMLKPYTSQLIVNGQKCKGLRDTATTMVVADKTYVQTEGYQTGCIWARQAISKGSVCLPTAKVRVEGPFGVLETVAAVSKQLPKDYPYLLSNSSEALLNARGFAFLPS